MLGEDRLGITREDIAALTYDELKEHIRLAKVNRELYQHVSRALLTEMESRSPLKNYKCFKCTHGKYELREIRVSQSFWSGLFDFETGRYEAVVCARCKFTEFYQGEASHGEQVADFLFGRS